MVKPEPKVGMEADWLRRAKLPPSFFMPTDVEKKGEPMYGPAPFDPKDTKVMST